MSDEDPEATGRAGPAEFLTVPGRLLLVATLAGGAGAFYFYFMASYEDLPAGRYPVLLWLVPVAFAAAGFFFVAALVLERLSVRVYRTRADRQ